jgi:hypothetical protein
LFSNQVEGVAQQMDMVRFSFSSSAFSSEFIVHQTVQQSGMDVWGKFQWGVICVEYSIFDDIAFHHIRFG